MNLVLKKQTILRPVLSEKSLDYYKKFRVCTFLVDLKSTKKDIEFNFKEIFGIEPKVVRTVISRSQSVNRQKSRSDRYSRKYVKKAYVNIGENTLDLFENIK